MTQAQVKDSQEAKSEESAISAMGRAMMQPVTDEKAKTFDLGASLSARMTQKRQVIETAKEALNEAIALECNANAAQGAVSKTQGKVINILAQGVIAGLIDKPQVSAMLGDAYGYKAKADGTPGKTPDGAGSSLRKRIVTLSEAFAYMNGDIQEADKPRWLAEKTVEEIAPIVTEWLDGNLSPWKAYKDVTEKEKRASVALHFDHAKLLKIVEALDDDVTFAAIKSNPALVEVYTALVTAFNRELPTGIDF